MRIPLILAVCFVCFGCVKTQITPLTNMPSPQPSCQTTLYSDRSAAEKAGGVSEEVCLVTAYAPNIGRALDAARGEVCKCGVIKAFIKTTSDSDPFINPHVIIVGFR